ncbi:MAG: hypothetical protein PHF05_08115, partial [Candidatus Izemoplasmatales bacterium]|nr:hypothetical protein [Candidatus Izemoplasmatales bacterium]
YEYVRRKLSKIIIDGLVYEFVYNSYGDIELIKIAGVTILNNVYQNSESGIYNGLIDNTTYGVDVIRYTYDDEKRIKETYVNEVKINEFTYDSSGNIGKLIDYKTNTTYYYSYDSQNRLVSVKSTDGNNVGYEYVDGDLVRHTNINGQTEYIYLGEEKYLYSEEFDGFSITYYPEDGLLRKVDSIGIGNSNGYIYKKFIYDEFEKNIDGESRNYETNRIKEVNYKKNDGTYIGKLIYGYDSFDDSDCFGNIQKISRFNGSSLVEVEEFEYDIYNQLEFYRKENYRFNKFEEYSYTYDKRGNINTILKEIYNDDNGTYDSYLITYQYKQSGWVDELISVSINGITYTIGDYDIHGNPHTYFGYDISYEQRSITQLSKGSNTYNYSYNSSGIRISKNVNGLITNYVLDGNKIIRETRDGVDLRYFYDISGDIIAFSYNGD